MELKFKIPELLANAPIFVTLTKIVDLLALQKNTHTIYPRLVGGIVRDLLINKIASDIDLCTPLPPNEIIKRAKTINALPIPTGIKHGTITIILNNYSFEITTLRHDIKCNGRHAEVKFTDNFQEDARRRDFTINAISYCIKNQILYDYFDGITHLKERKVIFIGNAENRIHEDSLRIMRFFRFSSYYSNNLDENGYLACIKNQHLMKILSQERITSEFNKIVMSNNAAMILEAMKPILSTIKLETINITKLQTLLQKVENTSLALRLSVLFSDINTHTLKSLLNQMKTPNRLIKNIAILHERINQIDTLDPEYVLFQTIYENPNLLDDHLNLFHYSDKLNNDIYAKVKIYHQSQNFQFPVSGQDLIKLGFTGKNIGSAITTLKQHWINSKFKLTKQELLNLL